MNCLENSKYHVLLLLIALVPAACGGTETNITGPGNFPMPSLNFAPRIAVSPSPIGAQVSTDPAFQWQISFEVTLEDLANRGIRIDSAILTISAEGGGAVLERPFSDLVSSFQPNVPAGGSRTWLFNRIRYNLPNGGRRATANIHFEMETGVGDFRTMNFGTPIS